MLSGVSDILVIKQKDGTFKSTPFYVHFDRKNSYKYVSIKINNVFIPQLIMKLDECGDGYFLSTNESENTTVNTEKTAGKYNKRLLKKNNTISNVKSPQTNVDLSSSNIDKRQLNNSMTQKKEQSKIKYKRITIKLFN